MVDPSAIGPQGRKVKCSNCSNIWQQAPMEEEIKETLTPPEELHRPISRPSLPVLHEDQKAPMWLKVAASLLLFLGITAGILSQHKLFGLTTIIGLEDVSHFEITDFEISSTKDKDKKLFISISAEIKNNSDQPSKFPKVVVTMFDKKGEKVAKLFYPVDKETLDAKSTYVIEPKINNVPASVEAVALDIGNNLGLKFR